MRIPWVCGAFPATAISPDPGGSPLNVRWSSAPSRKSNGTEGPSSPFSRTVASPAHLPSRRGATASFPVIEASASAYGKSPLP